MPDFGIAELGLLGAGLFGGAEAGGAALGGEALAAGFGGAEALGTGATALGTAETFGGGLAAEGATGGGLFSGLSSFFGGGSEAALGGGNAIATGVEPAATSAFASATPAQAALPVAASPAANTGFDLASLSKSAIDTGEAVGGPTSLFGKLGAAITENPLTAAGVGLGAAGLGYNLYKGSQGSAERKNLSANSAYLSNQGKQMAEYLQTGTLPAGLAAERDKNAAAARARLVQASIARGGTGDPSTDSALAQDLANVDAQAAIYTAKVGQQLLETGIKEVGMADELWAQLIGIDQKQSAATGQAISNFAAALAGRPTQARSA